MAATSGPGAEDDSAYLDGLAVAVTVTNANGGVAGRPLSLVLHDDRGDPAESGRLLGELLSSEPVPIAYAGPGTVLSSLRLQAAQAGAPVLLLQGDLYTSRGLFPQVFQASIPWAWQARVIARYLVLDRKAGRVVFAGSGPEAEAAAAATREALGYWGGSLADDFTYPAGAEPPLDRLAGADAVIPFGSRTDVRAVVEGLAELASRPRIVGGADLLTSSGPAGLPPGTAACSTYTWPGWAQPIPRVAAFAEVFTDTLGGPPEALAHEAFDALRVLAEALRANEGRGGPLLVSRMESLPARVFSGLPVDLGPDDHVLPPRDELGLFTVAGPRERVDPWQEPGSSPWRPLMRTFTYDGSRNNILDRDRPVFFPFWTKVQPGPYYYRSRYGVVSGPADPLH